MCCYQHFQVLNYEVCNFKDVYFRCKRIDETPPVVILYVGQLYLLFDLISVANNKGRSPKHRGGMTCLIFDN